MYSVHVQKYVHVCHSKIIRHFSGLNCNLVRNTTCTDNTSNVRALQRQQQRHRPTLTRRREEDGPPERLQHRLLGQPDARAETLTLTGRREEDGLPERLQHRLLGQPDAQLATERADQVARLRLAARHEHRRDPVDLLVLHLRHHNSSSAMRRHHNST